MFFVLDQQTSSRTVKLRSKGIVQEGLVVACRLRFKEKCISGVKRDFLFFSQKNPDLDNQEIKKQMDTPGEVVQLVRLSANYYSKGLTDKAQAVANLIMDLGLENLCRLYR